MSIDYDCLGFCANCHCNLMRTVLSEGKQIEIFSGKAAFLELKLNDGSKMRITVCNECKRTYDHKKHSKLLMESIVRGWDKESDLLVADPSKPNFDPKWKENYMKVYSKKEIIE